MNKNLPIKIFVLAIVLVNLTELNRDKATAALDSTLVIKKENCVILASEGQRIEHLTF